MIYSPIRYDGVSRAPLSRRAWKVSASEDADEAPQLIDGDRWTYWSVPAAKLGAAVTIDLGAVETVTGLHFDLGERGYDAFARLRVESSLDGAEWTLVKTAEWGFPLRFDPRGQITTVAQRSQMVLFEPRAARWLRLTLVANFAKYDWSIGELTVFGRGEGDVVLRPPEFADPASPALAERRLYLQSLREPGNDGPLVELRRLYRSLGDLEKLRDVERLEAERFRPAIATDWRFGRDLKLLGYDWRATGARTVQVTYYWQAMRAIDDDYAAYLHFEDGVQGLQDDYLPGSPRTTSRWRAEEIVKDVRVLRVPAGVTDGSYPARLGVWIPSQKRQVRRGRYGGLGWWGAKATTLFHLDVAGDRVTVRSGT